MQASRTYAPLLGLATLAALGLVALPAHAQALFVNNAGFEAANNPGAVATTGFDQTTPFGWTLYNPSGVTISTDANNFTNAGVGIAETVSGLGYASSP